MNANKMFPRSAYFPAMDELDFLNPSFSKISRALGFPIDCSSTPEIAYVSLENSKISFNLSREDLVEKVSDLELAGVIAHETYHVVLKHFEEMRDSYYKKKGILKVAQEVTVNDRVENVLGMELPFRDDLITGDKFGRDFSTYSTREAYDILMKMAGADDSEEDQEESGESDSSDSADSSGGSSDPSPSDSSQDEENSEDSEDTTAPEDTDSSSNSEDEDESGESESDEDENLSPEEKGKKILEDALSEGKADAHLHGELSEEGANDLADALDSILEDLEDELDDDLPDDVKTVVENSTGIGIGGSDHTKAINEQNDAFYMNFAGLLKEINPKILNGKAKRAPISQDWTRPNRMFMSSYPEIILPTPKREESNRGPKEEGVPLVVFAVDTSPSISREYVDMMSEILGELPEDIMESVGITWSIGAVPYDKENPRISDDCGTMISAVTNWVESYKEKNPSKRVYTVVFTDGEYPTDHLNENLFDDYYFVAIPSDYDSISISIRQLENNHPYANIYSIEDFVS